MDDRRAGDRRRFKRALAAYVLGHDRGIVAATKGAGLVPNDPDSRDEEDTSADADTPADAPLRFGVPVPAVLSFHRGPDTWRERPATDQG